MTTDPFPLADAPRPKVVAPTHANVQPEKHRQDAFDAELLGRVGNDKIKIRKASGEVFAVHRFRLHEVEKEPGEPRKRLSNAQINELPWQGAGPDPLTHHEPDKPWRRVR
jgi:hypothetical protein